MCLYIKEGPYVAKKAFYTFKIGTNLTKSGYQSYVQGHKQKFGKALYAKMTPSDGTIHKGLHSIYKPVGWHGLFEHAWFPGLCIVMCKIPKGSTYYVGESGDIVSDELIPIESIIRNENVEEKGTEIVKCSDIHRAIKLSIKVAEKLGYNLKLS